MTDFAKLVMGADTSGLKNAQTDLDNVAKGSKKTEDSVISLNKGMIALSAAAAGLATALAVGVKHAINTADSYSKMSQRLGIAVSDLSVLAHEADLSGASLESLAMGVQFLSRNMAGSLQSATSSQALAFKALGISVVDSTGHLRDSQDVLADLADRFANMPDGAQKTAAAMDLVGRGGAQLIPLLNGGSAAMKAMKTEAEALGLVISDKMAKEAEDFNDNMDRVKAGLEGVFNIIAAKVLPKLAEMSTNLVALTKDGVQLFSENLGTLTTVLDHVLIAATSFAVYMGGKFVVSLISSGVAALAPTLQMLLLAASIDAVSLASSIAAGAFRLLKLALAATGLGLLIIGAGELAALLIELREKTGSWGEAFALVGGVISGFFKDFISWIKTAVSAGADFVVGIAKAVKAAVTGGDISKAFLDEFDNIKFGASSTMEAIDKLNAALHPEINIKGNKVTEKVGTNVPTPPSQEVLDAYNKLVKSLTEQAAALGMSEQMAAQYNAATQLAAGSTGDMQRNVWELASKLFDAKKAYDATKATADSYKSTMDELNASIDDQFGSLYKTDEQIAIDNALRKVSGVLTEEMIKNLTQQAKLDAALKRSIEDRNKLERAAADLKHDLMTKQQLLNEKIKEYGLLLAGGYINQTEFDKAIGEVAKSLNIDTRSIGEAMWDGLKSTFFDPFAEGAQRMADDFLGKLDQMASAADDLNNSGKSTVDKVTGTLDAIGNFDPTGTVKAISTAIKAVKAVVGIVKSIGEALFGGSWKTTGGGLQLQLGAQGVTGQTSETQHKSGGLFSSAKDRTLLTNVGADQQDQFNTAYGAILDNAATAFSMFGIQASRDIMGQVQIAALNIKTSGEGALSQSDAQAAVQKWFNDLESAVVNAVGGSDVQALLDLATDGETATQTLIRLANQMNVTNALLDSVNVSMYAVGVSGAVMADSLVKMAGGMDKFSAGVSAFFNYFFTADEQFDKLTGNLTTTFSALNMTLPDTRAGVRDLVNGLDLTTEAGQRAFAAITGSSEALNTYYTTLETNSASLIASIRNQSDNALSALKDSIDAEKAIKQTAYNESIQQINDEAKAKTDAANVALAAAKQNLTAIQNEVNQINNALGNAQSQIDPAASQRNAVAFLRAALQSGNFTGTGAAAQSAARLNAGDFATAADFRRAQSTTLNLLGELSANGQNQINYAQLTIDSINNEIVAIQASTSELIDVETLLFDKQIKALDTQLLNAQNQLNELRGINIGVLSVESALHDFYTAITAERGNGVAPPGTGTGSTSAEEVNTTAAATLDTLQQIKSYTQATATAVTKDYNLNDRQYRDAQSEVTA